MQLNPTVIRDAGQTTATELFAHRLSRAPRTHPPPLAQLPLLTYQCPAAALRAIHAQQVAIAIEVQHAVQQVVLGLEHRLCCVVCTPRIIILSALLLCWGLPACAGRNPAMVFSLHEGHKAARVLESRLCWHNEVEAGVADRVVLPTFGAINTSAGQAAEAGTRQMRRQRMLDLWCNESLMRLMCIYGHAGALHACAGAAAAQQ